MASNFGPSTATTYSNPSNISTTPDWTQTYGAAGAGSLPNYSNIAQPSTFTAGIQPGVSLAGTSQAVTGANIASQTAANAARIPGETGLETQSSSNIGQELKGQLPADVMNQLAQQAAEAGIGGSSSPAAYLKALGLTSLSQENQGQTDLTAATARNPGAQPFDASSMLLTPAQAGQMNLQQQGQQLTQAGQQGQQGGGYGATPSYPSNYGSTAGTGTSPMYGVEPAESAIGQTMQTGNSYVPNQTAINSLYGSIPSQNMYGGSGGFGTSGLDPYTQQQIALGQTQPGP
jgi:hypothetical protein